MCDDLITVIVAIYNGEKYLKKCIESVMNQTYKNLEIILVDDGSTDSCGKIVDEFARKDSRIQAIHKKNSGVSSSRNAALDIATGKYICIIDQDDFIVKDYVEYYHNLIVQYNAEIAVTPRAKRFTGNPKEIDEKSKDENVEVIEGKEAAIRMLYYKFIIAPWNKMISRNLIENNNLRFDHRFFSGEGFLFSIECFQRAKRVAVGQREVYYYRLDNVESGMTRFNKSVINSSISAQNVIEAAILDKTPDIMQACKYANWHTHYDCLNTIVGCNAIKDNERLYKEIKEVVKKNAAQGLHAPISNKEKFKALLYYINPYIAARVVNVLRKRKFTNQ